ncbi:hypothetical protein [Aliikangiella sp. IMCC44359]|uniref:hypothetical protein n=1 Tax=Aliikangiella sp. IMCC44359 TaxID=3459125 RepID=UPI00403B22F6
MSQQYGFIEQLRDIFDRLSKAYYKGHSYAETGKNQKFTTDAHTRKAIQSIFSYGFPTTELQPGSKEQITQFNSVFFNLFPEEANSKKQAAPATTQLVPATNFLQFPFKRNQRWYVSGTHTTSGSGSWPQSSIDFHNGGYYHLNNIALSGYKIHTGRNSYDTNCNYFYLIKNGHRYCAGYYTNYGSTRASESTIDKKQNSDSSSLNTNTFLRAEKF